MNRRATIFAGDFDDENELIQRSNLKNYRDLKKQDKLDIIQYRIVGKPRMYEITGESKQNMLIRFLLHFLFVEHDHKTISLFDEEDPAFKIFKKQSHNFH